MTGWLIERTFLGAGGPLWWGYRDGMEEDWTSDPLRAVRFCRREDAMWAIHMLGDHMMKATEHRWLDVGTE